MLVKLEVILVIAQVTYGFDTGPTAVNDSLLAMLENRLAFFQEGVLALVRRIIDEGIPKANVPRLDPFKIENTFHIGSWNHSGIVQLIKADLSNGTIRNVGSFDGNPFVVKINLLPPWQVNFTFNYKSIYGDGRDMSVDLTVGDIIPFTTQGEFSFNVTDLSVTGGMSIDTNINEHLIISSLTADISIGGVKTSIANAFAGQADITQRIGKLLDNVAPEIVEKFKTSIVPDILEVLREKMNELLVLLDVKVPNFISCLSNTDSETCPFF